ncbi:phage antirepressor [Fusobacterium varium]|uniref:phage antirepressor n=1 Tax=Fusobacterium varium TaxID=856 RepID=UPI002FE4B23A
MNELITIKNVRGYADEKGTAYLNLEDVARGLGFEREKNGKMYVMWDRVNKYLEELSFHTCVESDFIPENVFYKLCMKANNEVARKFQDLVCDEILPSIRKNGMYVVDNLLDNPDLAIQAFTKLKEEREKRKELEIVLKENKPKVIFAEAVEASKTSILIGELAKLLKQNGHDIGQKRLFFWLRENGYLIKREGSEYNMPTQKSMDLGLFEIKETAITHSDGHITVNKPPKVTGKGQIYFMNKFKIAA